ncbi:MAG: response regulator, partial [Pseudomonadota bacterium]
MKNSTRSLHEVIESTVELAAPRASDKGLSLICRMHPTCKDLFTFDAWCITQLLSNLLSNALQYTDCGRVMVSVSCEDIDGLEGYRIVVEDSGPGIAAPIREAMFALPDQREHMSDHESMGYGMLISRQLAHMIGATLEIDSAADRGTRVTVAGPANHMVDGQQKTGIIASALRDTQALIVDSDMAARRVLEAHLRSWGVDVRSVLDVASAFDRIEETAAREQTISMVFVSSNVSDEDMRILVGGLSEDPRCRDVMLVSIDHSNPVDTAMSCLHASSNPRLPTPIKPNELFDCVAQHPFVSSQSLHLGEPSVENPASETLRRVLLVEDNIVNQCVASEILKRIGVQVDIANNGVEALQRLGAGHYDFVFMDCQMPEMDGFQATQEIRQRGDLNDLPVVALTANALSGDRQRCLDAGMNDYLTKPFSKAQLEKMLEKWIGP